MTEPILCWNEIKLMDIINANEFKAEKLNQGSTNLRRRWMGLEASTIQFIPIRIKINYLGSDYNEIPGQDYYLYLFLSIYIYTHVKK